MHPLLAAAVVTVRIYNYAAVPAADLAAARANADLILQDAGLSLQWANCRVPGVPDGLACTEPLREAGEFVLRLQTGTAVVPHQVALGSSLIDSGTGSGVLITIDPRLVQMVADEAGAQWSTVLGRAIAHELGHLLMGSPGHSRNGLMRALWSQKELRRGAARDWLFSAEEGERMVRNLQSTRTAGRAN